MQFNPTMDLRFSREQKIQNSIGPYEMGETVNTHHLQAECYTCHFVIQIKVIYLLWIINPQYLSPHPNMKKVPFSS